MGRKASQPKTPEQKVFAAKDRERLEFQSMINKEVCNFVLRLQEKNPKYSGFGVKPLNIAYVKGQKGISKAYLEIADAIVLPSNVDKTQVAILKDVQEKLTDLNLHPNIWNKPLTPSMKKKVETRVNCNIPKPVDLRKCDTLAKIRKKVKAAQQKSVAVKTFKTTIAFSRGAVVIGKTSHPLVMRTSGGKTYPSIRVNIKNKGQCWVRMDGLVAALKEA